MNSPDMHLWKQYCEGKYVPRFFVINAKEIRKRKNTRLDLHGYTLHNAWQRTLDFIENSHLNHIKKIEIITGQGGPSESIRSEMPHWLEHPRILHHIKKTKQHTGSVTVWLK